MCYYAYQVMNLKFLNQFLIIISVSFAGEVLHVVLPLPVPASIYGLMLMLGLLFSGIVTPERISETSSFLLESMPVMIVPAGAGVITMWGTILPILAPMIVIMTVGTVVVMAVSGLVTQGVICAAKARSKEA